MTQARLAEMAGVSTPTISHFESGDKDIQLSTVISILNVLGMNDRRNLVFTEKDERYDASREVVRFSGKDGDKAVSCAISLEALEDYFGGDNKPPLKTFQTNRERIEHAARRKYLAGNTEKDGSILLKTTDNLGNV